MKKTNTMLSSSHEQKHKDLWNNLFEPGKAR